MAGTRTVYRGNKGRFAGASGGKAEKVKSGGFANAAFQARFQSMRAGKTNARPAPSSSQKASPSKSFGLGHKLGKVAVVGGTSLLAGGAVRSITNSKTAGAVAALATVQVAYRAASASNARPSNLAGKKIKR